MKTFWLFRTNLRQLEYYHNYNSLEEFKAKCHDFYLLQGIWFLENNVFDEVVIWRLAPKDVSYQKEIIFKVGGKRFIQIFVERFEECLQYNSFPDVTFFRGGFKEYGDLTRKRGKLFGKSLYCGTGQRVYPQHGGRYDKILIEDERDLKEGCVPFYKTANPNMFKLLDVEKEYDICWPCNFSQITYKGQEWFIRLVGTNPYLKNLNIVHVGNKPEIGKALCRKHHVGNISFLGYQPRAELNIALNKSRMAIVTSNLSDGCPRIITETMASGTPLLLRDQTRALNYYRDQSIVFDEKALIHNVRLTLNRPKQQDLGRLLNMDNICNLNLQEWGMV